ncbi:SRPBCC family protein [Arthrobacter sp. H35-D1]|uniref:SRPBCC family protein n=1 Tax=Arthrobacter sp. H35-D1 TaxID=3046202 RepID=UPI0024BB123A|nr:SRPBCC family protein [Arthrobacter sp. H35-D1]MDJ0313126.1 SRPBCC family protein [Arthrobacter sp. H35-D1]
MTGQVEKDSIFIAAPAAVIFAILSDPSQHPAIDGSNTVRHLRKGPPQLAIGSTFTVSMRLWGVRYRVTNRVVEFESNRLIAWRHFEPQRWRYELEPHDAGTRVTESFDYTYWSVPGRLFLRVLRWPARNKHAIAQTLLRLIAVAETPVRA